MIKNLSTAALLALVLTFASVAAATAAGPKITSGARTTCALSDAGAVSCWGENTKGALGNGNTDNTHVAQPVIGLSAGVVDISVGESFACALRSNGSVVCWGNNSNGQLTPGAGDGDPHPAPVEVPGISGAVSVAASYSSVCVVLADATARCWGHNFYGQMGNAGITGSAMHPIVQVQGVSNIKEIDAANFGFCALIQDGTVSCWGMNWEGQLGRMPVGFGEHSSTPATVAGIAGATQFAGGDAACVLIGAEAIVRCWGDNGYYGVGDPSSPTASPSPVTVPGISGVVRLMGSSDTKCVWLADNSIRCWGFNSHHQLSPENDDIAPPISPVFSSTPLLFSDGGNAQQLCWMSKGGGVTCRGSNYSGESGSPNINDNGVGDTVVPGADLVTRSYPVASSTFKRVGKVTTDRRKKSYRLKADAAIVPGELVSLAEACGGVVKAVATWSYRANKTVRRGGKKKRIKVKRKKTWKTSAPLATVGSACVARIDFKKLPVKTLNRKRVAISASFAGNGATEAVKFTEFKTTMPRVRAKSRR